MYDILIQNGNIIDGSGREPYVADLAIQDGRIVKIAPSLTGARTLIDATGLAVTPGFIDSHSHADNAIFTFPDMKEKVEQGITTSVAGQCGTCAAPMPANYDKSKEKMLGDYREADVIRTVGTFLAYGSRVPQGANLALFAGHGAIRKAVMGLENRAPTEEELEKMKELLREALRGGACGMSLGLYYAPGSYANTEEAIALAKVVREEGGVLSAHIRGEGDTVLEATEEYIRIVKESGVRAVHSHVKTTFPNTGKIDVVLGMIDRANAEGADIYCDVYPYTASHTSLSASFVPRELHADGKLVENLKDPAKRAIAKAWVIERYGADDDLSWALVVSAQNRPDAIGRRIPEIAAARGCDVYDAIWDIIVDSNNHAGACYFKMDEADMEQALCHPRAMICTDSSVARGATTFHPRLRAAFPRAIGRYARDKHLLSLPEIIRKMTSLPAYVYGLDTKGLLREGYDADLCIFSAETLIDRAEYTHCTAGCEGLRYVIVSGEVVATDAIHNGKRCGRVLRRSV